MKYKKEYNGKAEAIITEAYIFTNFRRGELPKWKFYTPVAAWDTGAEFCQQPPAAISAEKNFTKIASFFTHMSNKSIFFASKGHKKHLRHGTDKNKNFTRFSHFFTRVSIKTLSLRPLRHTMPTTER